MATSAQYTKTVDDSDVAVVGEAAATTVTGVPMVEVVAPSNLPEGYKFEAQMGDNPTERVEVTVPQGGVTEGQRFVVPAKNQGFSIPSRNVSVPVGHWKDGLCNCCVHGCCHPMCCMALWLRPLAIAQVMTRMNLDWLGGPGTSSAVSKTFGRVALIFFAYTALTIVTSTVNEPYLDRRFIDEEGSSSSPPLFVVILRSINQVAGFCFFIYLMVLMIRTRAEIRNRYNIPEQSCRGCEDCCCAFWCGACAVCQMGRHTGDYEVYAGQCCTKTGLPRGVEVV